MSENQREMTLAEWVGELPSIHLANREYRDLIATVGQLKTEHDSLRTVLIKLRTKLQRMLGEERTAKREAIKINNFIVERVRQGRFNLAEDMMNELNDRLIEHGVTLETKTNE